MKVSKKKIGIITGASSGLGEDFAHIISRHYTKLDEIWLIARRTRRIEELAASINIPCRLITADLSTKEDIEKIKRLLDNEKPDVKLLINSAGFGKLGNITDIRQKDLVDMISVNCIALTQMVYHTLPFMRKGSILINIASSAAFLPQPGFAVYSASKSYVLSFTRALCQEVKHRGIKVTAVCPGPVKTEFFDIAEEGQNIMWYKKLIMVDSNKVVEKAMKDARENKELSIYGVPMNLFYIISKIIPHRVILKLLRIMNRTK